MHPILRRLDALNAHLEARGFPAMSPWWRETIGRWYEGGRRQLVVRAGRRGGKSSSLIRLAVVEAIYGTHPVPPGDVGVVAIVSARRPDALERLRTVAAILDALGVEYRERGDSIELPGRRRVFTVFTASVAGVSGFTSIFVFLDECAKWRDSDSGSNPAAIVIGSIRPTLATQPNGKIVLSSSPMGLLDAHADEFARGDTPLQTTAHAPTWVANPTLTEAATRELEPDEVAWAREYAAIPQAEAETSLLMAVALDKCTRPTADVPPDDRHTYVATIDPATRGNAWTLTVGTLGDGAVRSVVLAREWRGTKAAPLRPGAIFGEIATLIRPYRLAHVHSDQWAEDAMRESARSAGLALLVTPWTASLKADAYDGLRTLVQEGKLSLPADPVFRTDLLGIRLKLTRTGISYELASLGPRHSDYAPSTAMLLTLLRVPAVPIPSPQTESERHAAWRNSFLEARTREKRREERSGPLPVTHGAFGRRAMGRR